MRRARHGVPEALDAERILTNNEGTEDVHGLGGSGLPRPRAALTPAGDAGVGLDLDEHPAGRTGNRGNLGDLHVAASLILVRFDRGFRERGGCSKH